MNIEKVLVMAVKLTLTVMWDVDRLGCPTVSSRPPNHPLLSISKFFVLHLGWQSSGKGHIDASNVF